MSGITPEPFKQNPTHSTSETSRRKTPDPETGTVKEKIARLKALGGDGSKLLEAPNKTLKSRAVEQLKDDKVFKATPQASTNASNATQVSSKRPLPTPPAASLASSQASNSIKKADLPLTIRFKVIIESPPTTFNELMDCLSAEDKNLFNIEQSRRRLPGPRIAQMFLADNPINLSKISDFILSGEKYLITSHIEEVVGYPVDHEETGLENLLDYGRENGLDKLKSTIDYSPNLAGNDYEFFYSCFSSQKKITMDELSNEFEVLLERPMTSEEFKMGEKFININHDSTNLGARLFLEKCLTSDAPIDLNQTLFLLMEEANPKNISELEEVLNRNKALNTIVSTDIAVKNILNFMPKVEKKEIEKSEIVEFLNDFKNPGDEELKAMVQLYAATNHATYKNDLRGTENLYHSERNFFLETLKPTFRFTESNISTQIEKMIIRNLNDHEKKSLKKFLKEGNSPRLLLSNLANRSDLKSNSDFSTAIEIARDTSSKQIFFNTILEKKPKSLDELISLLHPDDQEYLKVTFIKSPHEDLGLPDHLNIGKLKELIFEGKKNLLVSISLKSVPPKNLSDLIQRLTPDDIEALTVYANTVNNHDRLYEEIADSIHLLLKEPSLFVKFLNEDYSPSINDFSDFYGRDLNIKETIEKAILRGNEVTRVVLDTLSVPEKNKLYKPNEMDKLIDDALFFLDLKKLKTQTDFNQLLEALPKEQKEVIIFLQQRNSVSSETLSLHLNLPTQLDVKMLKTLLEISDHLKKVDSGQSNLNEILKEKQSGALGNYEYYINNNQVVIVKNFLARGTYKKVNVSIDLKTNKSMVRSKISPEKFGREHVNNIVEDTIEEQKILTLIESRNQKLENTHVIPPFEIMARGQKDKIIFFSERFYSDGRGLLKAPFKQQVKALVDVGIGLNSVHRAGFTQYDLKANNILCNSNPLLDTPVEVYISDMGLTQPKGVIGRGSPLYAPPENLINPSIHAGLGYDEWSYGMLAFELCFRGDYLNGSAVLEDLEEFLDLIDKKKTEPAAIKLGYDDMISHMKYKLGQKRQADPANFQHYHELFKVIEGLIAYDPTKRLSPLEASNRFKEINERLWAT